MTGPTGIQTVVVLLALAAGVGALLLQPAGSGHDLFHVNCPPGSHGIPRSFGEGQRLEQARAKAKAAREQETAKP